VNTERSHNRGPAAHARWTLSEELIEWRDQNEAGDTMDTREAQAGCLVLKKLEEQEEGKKKRRKEEENQRKGGG
jgi:hypothetical protein